MLRDYAAYLASAGVRVVEGGDVEGGDVEDSVVGETQLAYGDRDARGRRALIEACSSGRAAGPDTSIYFQLNFSISECIREMS